MGPLYTAETSKNKSPARILKPLPAWLFYLIFWTVIPPAIIAMMVLEVTRRSPKGTNND